jgi:uncharacterized protein (DUF2237 family)
VHCNASRETAIPTIDRNVLGGRLEPCSTAPLTGSTATDAATPGPRISACIVVCTQVTRAFLEFARKQGNDLITPVPEYGFPGLKPGDRWCVCAATWRQAYEAGVASPVVLTATHEETLAVIPLDALKQHALDLQ